MPERDRTFVEVLSDFEYHYASAEDSLRAVGFMPYRVFADTIGFIVSPHSRQFVPDSGRLGVGYLFLDREGARYVCNGVFTNIDLIRAALTFLTGDPLDTSIPSQQCHEARLEQGR